MTHIIALTNQKGGVGKTTTAVNLAAAFGALKKRALLVDLDPQGNATTGSGADKYDLAEGSVLDVLLGEANAADVIVECGEAGYSLLPGNADLTAAEVSLLDMDERDRRLAESLAPVKERFDVILIDCPPSLNMLTVNALTAADGVVIPLQCEFYALEGLSALLDTIEQVRASINPALAIYGILRTMYDNRISLTRDVSKQLLDYFGDDLLKSVIPRNIRLAEAPSHGLPVNKYARMSRGSHAYRVLAKELAKRLSL